jgi:hypothetical protein
MNKNAKLRKLSLNRETLVPLNSDQLDDVNGGVVVSTGTVTVSVRFCSKIVEATKQASQAISQRICPGGGGAQ